MGQKRVVLASGKHATVSDEWIERWPEDIAEVLGDEASQPASEKPAAKSRRGKKTSAVKEPPQKPAPEVPESNNSSVDENKEN